MTRKTLMLTMAGVTTAVSGTAGSSSAQKYLEVNLESQPITQQRRMRAIHTPSSGLLSAGWRAGAKAAALNPSQARPGGRAENEHEGV